MSAGVHHNLLDCVNDFYARWTFWPELRHDQRSMLWPELRRVPLAIKTPSEIREVNFKFDNGIDDRKSM
jgi:hypothetical protein